MASCSDPIGGTPKENRQAILVVEDDPMTAHFLAEYLHEEKAYHVCLAANASRALEIVQALQPCLIVIDQLLPGMRGLEMHDQLQTMQGLKSIPVLIMSAVALSEEASQHHLPFLRKPFTLEELDAFVDDLCPHQKAG